MNGKWIKIIRAVEMNFFCFSFALNQRCRAANLLRLIATKSVPKYALRLKNHYGNKKNNENLRIYERKGLLMQYHSINIEKLQKRMKNKFVNIGYQIRWSVGDDFKIIVSTKSNTVERNHSDESHITRIYITFLEKHFSAKVY